MTSLKNHKNVAWVFDKAAPPHHASEERARNHQNTLTKPLGSLGALESLAIRFAGFQGKLKPSLNTITVRIFAGDHGVCAQGVSAFPQIVTTQMIENFVRGGAAISVLSRHLNADFNVVNMGIAHPLISTENVQGRAIAEGTQDFTQGPAMSPEQCITALATGREFVTDSDLFIGGEMGIGNTTSASALFSLLLDLSPDITVGPGTGVDSDGLTRKCAAITQGLTANKLTPSEPLEALCALGGFEIVALAGAYIAAAQRGVPVLVDGFITTAAALAAYKINPSIKPWLLFSHRSAEPAHTRTLEAFDAQPLLDLGLRLGEGSGAALAVPIIKSALALHGEMATFDQAGVSENG